MSCRWLGGVFLARIGEGAGGVTTCEDASAPGDMAGGRGPRTQRREDTRPTLGVTVEDAAQDGRVWEPQPDLLGRIGSQETPPRQVWRGTAGSAAAEMPTLPRWRLPERHSQEDSHVSGLTKSLKKIGKPASPPTLHRHAHALTPRECTRCNWGGRRLRRRH